MFVGILRFTASDLCMARPPFIGAVVSLFIGIGSVIATNIEFIFGTILSVDKTMGANVGDRENGTSTLPPLLPGERLAIRPLSRALQL
ncbi:hypothetical protein TEQG_04120 [Trichophyton equinum CBS 127.97]|uniref:Uncharacterized protein n=1 Tax=Trichophyton equinum (strain ATCC MYA-4606 / CBS 127.97) TaxID=559882 RepID=F2PT84_TRIEC|nr:hypothetical protein TEQG_04120 [Trichophyton equinum CBS 127.97]